MFKPVKRKAIEYFIAYFIYSFVSIGLHEYFHANIARMLGYRANVVFYWLEGYTLVQGLTYQKPIDVALIAISGGLFTAFIFSLIYLYYDWETDLPEMNALHAHILYQFIYSFIEVAYMMWWITDYQFIVLATVTMSVLFAIFLLNTLVSQGG